MSTSSSLRLRTRIALRLSLVALASIGAAGTLAVAESGTAVASTEELAINELAPEISAAADQAIAALENYLETGDPADGRTLAWHRAIAARYTARQIGYDELAMVDAWSSAPLGHQRAVLGALSQLGVPYRTNTSKEDVGFDCSGITTYAWAGAGVELFRQSGVQIKEAEPLTRETAKAGDLVHYPGHVMMYLGVDDAIVHSIQTGRTVEVDTISARRTDSVKFGDPSV